MLVQLCSFLQSLLQVFKSLQPTTAHVCRSLRLSVDSIQDNVNGISLIEARVYNQRSTEAIKLGEELSEQLRALSVDEGLKEDMQLSLAEWRASLLALDKAVDKKSLEPLKKAVKSAYAL